MDLRDCNSVNLIKLCGCSSRRQDFERFNELSKKKMTDMQIACGSHVPVLCLRTVEQCLRHASGDHDLCVAVQCLSIAPNLFSRSSLPLLVFFFVALLEDGV